MNKQNAAVSLFKPNKQESKAQTTDSVARAIIDKEVSQRDAKTAKLRAARLAMEAQQPAPVAPKAKKAKRAR
jgi:hypothetical protein